MTKVTFATADKQEDRNFVDARLRVVLQSTYLLAGPRNSPLLLPWIWSPDIDVIIVKFL